MSMRQMTLLSAVVTMGLFAWVVQAADVAKDAKPAGEAAKTAEKPKNPKDVEDKLLKLTTMEQAFLRANQDKVNLERFIVQESAKLEKATTEDEKTALRKDLGEARKKYQTIAIAMAVIFNPGNVVQYEYDTVKSTVHIRVGTVEETFARAVQTREALKKFVTEQTAARDAEKDAAKKAELEKKVDTATKQYQLVSAALQLVYTVAPERSYLYDPKSSTLYLKVSENEADKLKAEVEKLKEDAKKASDAAKGDTPKSGDKKAGAAKK